MNPPSIDNIALGQCHAHVNEAIEDGSGVVCVQTPILHELLVCIEAHRVYIRWLMGERDGEDDHE